MESIVGQLMEKQRLARQAALVKQLECGCADGNCGDGKSCTHPMRRTSSLKGPSSVQKRFDNGVQNGQNAGPRVSFFYGFCIRSIPSDFIFIIHFDNYLFLPFTLKIWLNLVTLLQCSSIFKLLQHNQSKLYFLVCKRYQIYAFLYVRSLTLHTQSVFKLHRCNC